MSEAAHSSESVVQELVSGSGKMHTVGYNTALLITANSINVWSTQLISTKRPLWAEGTGPLAACHKHCSVTTQSSLLRRRRFKRTIAVFRNVQLSCAITLCDKHYKKDLAALKPIPSAFATILEAAKMKSSREIIRKNGSHSNVAQWFCAA